MGSLKTLSTVTVISTLLTACVTKETRMPEMDSELSFHLGLLTVDTHCDTPLRIVGDAIDPSKDNSVLRSRSKVDFPRMERGGLDAAFFAIFIGQGERSEAGFETAWKKMLMYREVIDSVLAANPSMAELALHSSDAARIKANGKLAIYLGLENGYPVGRDITQVQRLYDMGVRYVTLCHMLNNDICDSYSSDLPFPIYTVSSNRIRAPARKFISFQVLNISKCT